MYATRADVQRSTAVAKVQTVKVLAEVTEERRPEAVQTSVQVRTSLPLQGGAQAPPLRLQRRQGFFDEEEVLRPIPQPAPRAGPWMLHAAGSSFALPSFRTSTLPFKNLNFFERHLLWARRCVEQVSLPQLALEAQVGQQAGRGNAKAAGACAIGTHSKC